MIKQDPAQRATLPQVLSHPWLKETNELESDTEDEDEEDGDEERKSHKPGDKSETKKKESA